MKRLSVLLLAAVTLLSAQPASAAGARNWWVEYADGTVGIAPATTAEQDLTTLLSKFLNDLYAGTLGVTMPIAKVTVTNSAIGTTSTDGELIQNATAATSGVTVQMSPRTRWCGSAYNSTSTLSETDCFFAEVLPATNAGTTTATWRLGRTINSGAATNILTLDGVSNHLVNGAFTIDSGDLVVGTTGSLMYWASHSVMKSATDGLWRVSNNGQTFGLEVNAGSAAPTVATCGTGAVTTHSSNTAGEVTATGATTCSVVFGAPNFTNQPFCTVTDETTAAALKVSAISVSGFTVAGLTTSDKFMYTCFGGV